MIVFIGLGNVGEKYKETKHNAGFWIMDEMAARHKISFSPGSGDYVIASKTDKFHLVKPSTGMNRSGNAVSQLIKSKNILPEQICVILDDVDLPLGKIRIKPVMVLIEAYRISFTYQTQTTFLGLDLVLALVKKCVQQKIMY